MTQQHGTTIVVQVAMAEEAQPFIDLADEVSDQIRIGGAEHRGLVIGGTTLVLVRSGIGFVNAASAATGALHRYGPEGVVLISAGSAGGLAADVRVGDVIVGEDTINVEAMAVAFGYVPGQVPGMPATYPPTPDLVRAIRVADVEGVVVRGGAMGSGEKFVTSDMAAGLRQTFPSLVSVDMETSAVAATAHVYGVPFAAVRAISDLCAPDGTEFDTHIDDAAQRSANVVVAALPRIAA